MGTDDRSFVDDRTARLPPPHTTRWMPKRKAEIVAAVQDGILTLEEACVRYSLSPEEFLSWKAALETFGLPGLRRGHGRSPTRPKRTRAARHGTPSLEMSL